MELTHIPIDNMSINQIIIEFDKIIKEIYSV